MQAHPLKITVVLISIISAYASAASKPFALASNGSFDNRPIIVLREDDIRNTWRIPYQTFGGLSALQYGKLKQIPITWGIICSFAESGYGLTWAEIKDYLDTAGGEAISHSCTHSAMPDAQGYINELVNSKALIEQRLPGYTCTSFYQPGTWTGEAYLNSFSKLDGPIGQALQATYERSMAYLGGGWMVGPVYYHYGLTYSFSLDFWNPSVQQVLAVLDIVAATPGLIFIASCHGVAETGGSPSDVRADVMKAFMDRAAELRDAGQVRLMSLRDAYSAQFSPDLNRLADAGFELCNPPLLNSWGPWRLFGGSSVISGGAWEGHKYVRLIPKANALQQVIVQPGRYRLSWRQKSEAGSPPGAGVHCYVSNSSPDRSFYTVYGVHRANSAPVDTWQQHDVLLAVHDRMPTLSLELVSYSGGTLGIDDVRLVREPVDPSQSCSAVDVRPRPESVLVSWQTPPGSASTVQIRLGNRTHPQTLSEGVLLAQVPAVPGTRQEAEIPVNWASQTPGAFFSVFAVESGGQAAAPDIAMLNIDRSPPTAPAVTVSIGANSEVACQWTASDPDSAVARFRWAVGKSPGNANVIGWTNSTESEIAIPPDFLPHRKVLHLSVQAQNVFGYWSSVTSVRFQIDSDFAGVLEAPDDVTVGATGVVTAIFDDCCYIQQPGVPRGIKVRNPPACTEGETITVSGKLSTEHGERVLVRL